MNDEDFWIGTAAILLIAISGLYGVYYLGKIVERKALTKAFVVEFREAYKDGFLDGDAACMGTIKTK